MKIFHKNKLVHHVILRVVKYQNLGWILTFGFRNQCYQIQNFVNNQKVIWNDKEFQYFCSKNVGCNSKNNNNNECYIIINMQYLFRYLTTWQNVMMHTKGAWILESKLPNFFGPIVCDSSRCDAGRNLHCPERRRRVTLATDNAIARNATISNYELPVLMQNSFFFFFFFGGGGSSDC